MTRINCVPPEELTARHLIAEYRELPRVFALAEGAMFRVAYAIADRELDIPPARFASTAADRIRASCPTEYTLGAGHVRFFYARTGYLARRQAALIAECQRRGFNVAHTTPPASIPGLDADWTPTPEALAINRARIAERIAAKPDLYRH